MRDIISKYWDYFKTIRNLPTTLKYSACFYFGDTKELVEEFGIVHKQNLIVTDDICDCDIIHEESVRKEEIIAMREFSMIISDFIKLYEGCEKESEVEPPKFPHDLWSCKEIYSYDSKRRLIT